MLQLDLERQDRQEATLLSLQQLPARPPDEVPLDPFSPPADMADDATELEL